MHRLPRNPELSLIAQIQARTPQRPTKNILLGIGDDCAILRPPLRHNLLVTTDFSLENRHFRRDTHPAASVGHRTLARGLSDLAAMGATPLAAFLSLALPADLPSTASGRRWIASFLDGLQALAKASKVTLAGGDTAQAPSAEILADIVLLGSAPAGTALRRSTASSGDLLYVTGTLGGSSAELRHLLGGGKSSFPGNPHLYPQPRLAAGRLLRGRATACIDLSDGLATDLTHLCQSSRLRAEIDSSSLPLHPRATLEDALHGGEDYELLFAVSPATRVPRTMAGTPITQVGRLLKPSARRPAITLLPANTPLIPHPHHFQEKCPPKR